MHRLVLKDKVQIGRSAEEIWCFLQSPALMKDWNPKIKAVVPVSPGEPSENCRYRIRYEMNGKESNFLAEIMEYRKPSRLLIHLTGGSFPRRGYIQEIYELIPNAEGTLVTQQIGIYTSSMSLFSGYRAAFTHYFGKLSKKRYLMTLKQLAESS
jgi:Polyketide cyclase / dehydrase and lipid transport